MNKTTFLFFYIIIITILPKPVGFNIGFDITFWIIAGIIFILPSFIKHVFINNKGFSNIDLLFFLFILLDSFPILLDLGVIPAVGQIEKDFFYMYLPFFAGMHFFTTDKSLLSFFKILSIASIIISLLAFYEFYTEQPLSILTNLSTDKSNWETSTILHTRGGMFGTQRIAATFVHPIWLGVFVMVVFLINMLLLILFRKKINFSYGIVIIVQMLFGFIVLIISQSRTALASFILSLLLFIIIYSKKNLKTTILIYGLAFAIILITFYYFSILFPDITDIIIYDNISSKDAADNVIGRNTNYILMIIHIFSNINIFGEATVSNMALQKFILTSDMTNAFLSRLIVNGIIGGLIFIIIWFKGLRSSFKQSKKNKIFLIVFILIFYLVLANNMTTLRYQIEIISYILLGIAFNRELLIFTQRVDYNKF